MASTGSALRRYLLEASSCSTGAARVPEVTNEEEEGQEELGCTQPLTQVHVVHRVGLGDDAAHRVDRRWGRGSCTQRRGELARAECRSGACRDSGHWGHAGAPARTTEVPEPHGFTTKDDLAGGEHQVLTQTGGAHGRTDVDTHALVTNQEGEALAGSLSVGGAPELRGVSGVVEPDESRQMKLMKLRAQGCSSDRPRRSR